MKLENALQFALRRAGLAPALAPAAADPVVAPKQKCAPLYRYRGLPCSISESNKLWYVEGVDMHGGAGILEWCYDAQDAQSRLAYMQTFPQFSNLAACPHVSGSGINRVVKAVLASGRQHHSLA